MFGPRRGGRSGSAYAAVRARERRRAQPTDPFVAEQLFLQHDGLTHAQPHLITSPWLIVGSLVLAFVLPVAILAGLYLTFA